jgi:DNA-binding transcriptional MocR family regulator
MTHADEATFIALWQQGANYRELAAALRCPIGTVASRSAALAAQGKIQPRPRGGAKARQEGSPADRPPSTVHGLPSTMYRPPWTLDRPRSIIFVRTCRRP